MTGVPLLSLTIFLPLIGALFILFVRGDAETVARNARHVALWTTAITFVVSLFLWFGFEPGTADFQFVEEVPWFPEFNIAYRVGIDGIRPVLCAAVDLPDADLHPGELVGTIQSGSRNTWSRSWSSRR